MFNDHMTTKECQGLMNRLSDCAFPFQCAHGRPSMVPLVELGGGGKLLDLEFRADTEEKRDMSREELRKWVLRNKTEAGTKIGCSLGRSVIREK